MTAPISADEARRLREAAEAPLVATIGCGCSCHRWPGVKHVVACCNAPTFESQQAKDRRTNEVIAALAAEVERLTAAPCPHIIQGDEGTAYCALAEATVERLREALRGLTRFGQHPACLLAARYGSGRACSVCEATTAGLAALSDEGEK